MNGWGGGGGGGGGGDYCHSSFFLFLFFFFSVDICSKSTFMKERLTPKPKRYFDCNVIDTGFLQTQQAASVWLPLGSLNVRTFKVKLR